jgi:dTDP-4-dehydrorhamnose 3,5-epimerase-like enzyme
MVCAGEQGLAVYKRMQVQWVRWPRHQDLRGALTEIDFEGLPFHPRRIFYLSNVPTGTVRGGHAHRWGTQIMVCVAGKIQIECRHRGMNELFECVPDDRGLLIGEGVWSQQKYLVAGSAMMVLCSHPYDKDAYVGCDID